MLQKLRRCVILKHAHTVELFSPVHDVCAVPGPSSSSSGFVFLHVCLAEGFCGRLSGLVE